MKSVLIVIVMMLELGKQDLYIIEEPNFQSERECVQFVMLYNKLIITKARTEYPNNEIVDIYCVDKERIDQLYKQVKI